jgi:hypothetical protein
MKDASMPGQAIPPATPSDYEPLVTGSDLFAPLAKLNKFRKYWKTRGAILSGVPVYDMPKEEREKAGYFSAWSFNTAQSSLSATPALLFGIVGPYLGLKTIEDNFATHWFRMIWPICIPFVLMFTAYTVGRLSLWKRDATRDARVRAARIYLYLDGAYGLFPQLALSAVTIPELFPLMQEARVLQLIGFWQFTISMRNIPNDLFPALGYWGGRHNLLFHGTGIPQIFTTASEDENAKRVSQSEPPVWRYRLSVLVLAPAIAIGVAVIVLLCTALAGVILRKPL